MRTINKKEDWVLGGVEILRHKGIDGVKIEALARELGVTKGGFYGYFLNRDALLQSILDHWETALTDDIIGIVSTIEGTLTEKLSQLFALVNEHEDVALELSLVAWSFQDKRAAVVVNRVIRRRIDFMKNLFLEEGFSEIQSELHARLVHGFNHGSRAFAAACEAKDSPERKQIIDKFIELICEPAP